MSAEFASVMAQITDKVASIQKLEQEYEVLIGQLLSVCPVKVGDTVTITDGASKGKQMLVNSVAVVGDFIGGRQPRGFRVMGKVLYKNGAPSNSSAQFEISVKGPAS